MAKWDLQLLGSLLNRPPRYGINAAAVAAGHGTHTYIRITDIDVGGRFAPRPESRSPIRTQLITSCDQVSSCLLAPAQV